MPAPNAATAAAEADGTRLRLNANRPGGLQSGAAC